MCKIAYLLHFLRNVILEYVSLKLLGVTSPMILQSVSILRLRLKLNKNIEEISNLCSCI